MINPDKTGAGEKLLLSLEIFCNSSSPVSYVYEYAEIELRLTNQTDRTLEDCAVWLGNNLVRDKLTLRPGASWVIPFAVDDLVGELVFRATGPACASQARLEVRPQKLSWQDVLYIKTERLPALLARLDAPNGLQLSYQNWEEPPALFDFFSADYTAEKLRYFSQVLLVEGVSELVLDRLDYATPERRASDLYSIRGPVRWSATIQNWLNRPAETGLRHEWKAAPKDFATLPNLLFVRFQLELAQELTRLARFVEAGGPASAGLRKALPELKERASRHHALTQSPQLPPAQVALDWDRHAPDMLELLAQACEQAATSNPAYARLFSLWQAFTSRYVSLPEDEEALSRSGLQPMSKIYELWVVCEVAAALNLQFEILEDGPLEDKVTLSARSAVFSRTDRSIKLYYNKALRGGWYSANRRGLPRPDIRIEMAGQIILVDVKYRVGSQDRARPDDIYKMLAYMHDFGVNTGGIIFPGQAAGLKALSIENAQGQKLVELALRPPRPEISSQAFGQELGRMLEEKLL